MQTHNRHLDQTRAIVASAAFPSPVDPHDLDCAARLAENARLMLAEAYRLVKADNGLEYYAETAGKAAKRLRDYTNTRLVFLGETA